MTRRLAEPDSTTRCAAGGAEGVPLRLPTVPDPYRPDMRVCQQDRECFDRFHARRNPRAR